ncbi:MAG: hypothetical protein AAFO69_12520 [Bacteroidota bacterium]
MNRRIYFTILIVLSGLHYTTVANTPYQAILGSYNIYKSDIRQPLKGNDYASFTEVVVPSEFADGNILSVIIRFSSEASQEKAVGHILQEYKIEGSLKPDDLSATYKLIKHGTRKTAGLQQKISVLEELLLNRSLSIQYVFSGSLTDNLLLTHGGIGSSSRESLLNHYRFVADEENLTKRFSYQNTASADKKSWVDILLGEEETPSPAEEKTNSTHQQNNNQAELFDELRVDLDAFNEKREYELYLVYSKNDEENKDHVIQIGFYVPVKPKYGSVVRVLALRKKIYTKEIVSHEEFDYYLKNPSREGEGNASALVYPAVALPAIASSSGSPIKLPAMQLSIMKETMALALLKDPNSDRTLLVIQYSGGGAYGYPEGNFEL